MTIKKQKTKTLTACRQTNRNPLVNNFNMKQLFAFLCISLVYLFSYTNCSTTYRVVVIVVVAIVFTIIIFLIFMNNLNLKWFEIFCLFFRNRFLERNFHCCYAGSFLLFSEFIDNWSPNVINYVFYELINFLFCFCCCHLLRLFFNKSYQNLW